jgi:hypothetical protein
MRDDRANPYLSMPARGEPERAACARWLTVAAFAQTLAGTAVAAAGHAHPTRPLVWAGVSLAIGAVLLAAAGLGHARAAGAGSGDMARAVLALALAGLVALAGLAPALLSAGGNRLATILAFGAYAVPGALSALPLALVARRRFPLATAGGVLR